MAPSPAGAHLRRPELRLLRDLAAAHDVPQQGARAALWDSRGERSRDGGPARGDGLPQQVGQNVSSKDDNILDQVEEQSCSRFNRAASSGKHAAAAVGPGVGQVGHLGAGGHDGLDANWLQQQDLQQTLGTSSAKKIRESVGIFPKSGTPPPPSLGSHVCGKK